MRLKSVAVQGFQVRVPRDAEVLVFVVEPLDLDFCRGSLCAAFLDTLLDCRKIIR